MARTVFFCTFAFAIVARVSAAPTEQTCAGGYKEGEKVEKGSAWFECRNGQLTPKGCVSSNGDRLKLQDIYDLGFVRAQCLLADGGNPNLVNKSCVQENREYQPEERWDDGKYVYTCKKEGAVLRMQATGCIREGKKVNVGERLVIGEVVYECKSAGGASFPAIAPWGCPTKDGKQVAAGQEFDEAPYWYSCQLKDGIVSLELMGCVSEKTRFKNGDRFFKDDLVFECQAKENGGNMKVVGCMQKDPKSDRKIERLVGCVWSVGEAPFQVTMTCQPNQDTKTAEQIALHCDYKMPGSTVYSIGIGCYRIYEDVAVGCVKDPSGKVNAVSIPMSNGAVQSVPAGLKFC